MNPMLDHAGRKKGSFPRMSDHRQMVHSLMNLYLTRMDQTQWPKNTNLPRTHDVVLGKADRFHAMMRCSIDVGSMYRHRHSNYHRG
jgi:hypothetical protein